MTKFGSRPSRPIAITMVVAAALILVFGLVTVVRAGLPPFGLIWVGIAVLFTGFLVWRLLLGGGSGRSR